MIGTVLKEGRARRKQLRDSDCRRSMLPVVRGLTCGLPALRQRPPPKKPRMLEFGKEIFKSKGRCGQYCHKWDASGGPRLWR